MPDAELQLIIDRKLICYDLDNPVHTPDAKLYHDFAKERDEKWQDDQLRRRRVPRPVADTGSEPASVAFFILYLLTMLQMNLM